jgi:general secretion pathway protein G
MTPTTPCRRKAGFTLPRRRDAGFTLPCRRKAGFTLPRRRDAGFTLPRRRDAGFTLLELLVVLAILGLLAALTAPRIIGFLGGARSQAAAVQVRSLAQALDLYRLDVGRYPTQEQGLAALTARPAGAERWNGPYLDREGGLVDPWGHPYGYRIPGRAAAFDVWSLGADGAEGGEGEDGDVASW